MKVKVEFAAWSNIAYKGAWEFEVDFEEWSEMDEDARGGLVQELFQQKLNEDVGWSKYEVIAD